MEVFSVFDSKAEAFLPPFFCSNVSVAKRLFSAAANDSDHQFHRFAGDYTLFCLGGFDERTAKFDLADTPSNLGMAITYVRSE